MKKYYVLAVKNDGVWEVEFSDYDKSVVEFELEDFRDHGHLKKNLKILLVCATPDEMVSAIKDAVGKLNS